MGQRVTLEPRPRYNMSYRMRCRGLWHGRCLYNNQAGQPRERGQTRKGEASTAREYEESTGSDKQEAQPDTVSLNKNENTLLHTQASDRAPAKAGAFFYGLKTQEAFSAELREAFNFAPGKKRGFCREWCGGSLGGGAGRWESFASWRVSRTWSRRSSGRSCSRPS